MKMFIYLIIYCQTVNRSKLYLFLIVDQNLLKIRYYNFTPAPFKKAALSSNGHLGFAGKSNSLN